MQMNELKVGSKQLKTMSFSHRDGGAVPRLRQEIYDQKFTRRYSNVSASVGCYNNNSVVSWRLEYVEKPCESCVEIIAQRCATLKFSPWDI